ncbi:MAG: MMPL family transporter [Betaproteobacteria bacterium]|nr:MMPL family transporter [Betaproteobacteria bacterium]
MDVVVRFVELCIKRRVAVVTVIGVITVIMALFAANINIKTVFDDLLPRNHSYIKVNDQFKNTFGGSNIVSIMVEVEEGTIFNQKVLARVKSITEELQQVDAVNQFQIVSLASKKLREIRASTEGIDLRPLMWPEIPKNEEEMRNLQQAVLKNPLVLGAYVSHDLKATLITVDFHDHMLDYLTAFQQIREIVGRAEGNGYRIRVVGEPILYGWVNFLLAETLYIFLATVASLVAMLFLFTRTWRGTLLPLLAGLISCLWALGISSILKYNLDPLVIVVAFLITARSISHSVQLVTRFDYEVAHGMESALAAAKVSMSALFKPGMLGVIADAGCMIVVVLTPIPLLQKVAVIGSVWVMTIAVSAVILTPVLLSWVKRPEGYAHPIDISRPLMWVLDLATAIVTSRWRFFVIVLTVVVFVVSGIYSFNLKVGDANPGSPILWADSQYNQDAHAINKQFQGSDRMFVVIAGKQDDTLMKPKVLNDIVGLQKFLEVLPEVGGTISIADVIPAIKGILREGNPRYREFGNSANENGELMYVLQSGTEPGDIDRFTDARYRNGAVTIFFRDHQGETIRTAISRVKEYFENNPLKDAEYMLAGGLVGVLGAVNEVILSGQIESIALALLVLVICCTVTYRSAMAGLFFMVPVVISNTVTFSYMAFKGIGMNINTLPVAALGIGLGVDYAFYIVDGIREELKMTSDLKSAIAKSLVSAGRGVLVTASTLIAAVFLWCFSSLRFQAEMGILMAIWLTVSTASALFLMPSMVYILRPKFIVGDHCGRQLPTGGESDLDLIRASEA